MGSAKRHQQDGLTAGRHKEVTGVHEAALVTSVPATQHEKSGASDLFNAGPGGLTCRCSLETVELGEHWLPGNRSG